MAASVISKSCASSLVREGRKLRKKHASRLIEKEELEKMWKRRRKENSKIRRKYEEKKKNK